MCTFYKCRNLLQWLVANICFVMNFSDVAKKIVFQIACTKTVKPKKLFTRNGNLQLQIQFHLWTLKKWQKYLPEIVFFIFVLQLRASLTDAHRNSLPHFTCLSLSISLFVHFVVCIAKALKYLRWNSYYPAYIRFGIFE